MTVLTKAEYTAGVAEHQTRFVVACKVCKREEIRSATLNASDLDAERSQPAKRMRSSCKGNAPLPCKFRFDARLVELSHAQALDAGLCMPAPVLRLDGGDGTVVYATKINRPENLVQAARIAQRAAQDFEELAPPL